MNRTDIFLAVARAVEADALPAPREVAIYEWGTSLTFDDLAAAREWAEHFALAVSQSNLVGHDGKQLINTWNSTSPLLGAEQFHLAAYTPNPAAVAEAILTPDSIPEGVEGHTIGQRVGSHV